MASEYTKKAIAAQLKVARELAKKCDNPATSLDLWALIAKLEQALAIPKIADRELFMRDGKPAETPVFETGATSAQANDLVLSAQNDAPTVGKLHHAVNRALTQGKDVGMKKTRYAVLAVADKNRQDFGTKYPQKAISEAMRLLFDQTLTQVLENIASNYDATRPIVAYARKWFDKINGNSYFSVGLDIPQKGTDYPAKINLPFQYGYGSQWQYETLDTLARIGVLPPFKQYANGSKAYGNLSDYQNRGQILWVDQGWHKKACQFAGMYL